MYVVAGAVALVVVAIVAVLLRPETSGYRPGSTHAAVLVNEDPSRQCVGPDAWVIRVGDESWHATSRPPADWGSGPVSGEIEIVGHRDGFAGDNWAVFRHGDASIDLLGVKGVSVGCIAIG